MIQNDQKEQLIKIGNWISPRLERYETIMFFIVLAALLLKISTDLPTGIVLTLALSTLSILYFFNAFSFKEDEYAGGMERFIEKIAAFGASIGINGILFTLLRWPGGDLTIICGCGTLIITLPLIYYFKSRQPELKIFNSRMITRTILIGVLGLALNFTPVDILKKTGLVKEVIIERTE